MRICINPGTGPVLDATEEHATENIKHFITDCNVKKINCVRIPVADDGEGRYGFLLWIDTRCHEIQMPGLPLKKVRWMDDDQDIWDYPRLYVDGSSWIWKFALLDSNDDWSPGPTT